MVAELDGVPIRGSDLDLAVRLEAAEDSPDVQIATIIYEIDFLRAQWFVPWEESWSFV
jgi:hypothetical protein